MERRRGNLEIARDILKIAINGAGPTVLVYGANLNSNIIKRYLQELDYSGLILVESIEIGRSKTRLYTTTEKGLAFIEALSKTLEIYYSPKTIDGTLPEIMNKQKIIQGTVGAP